MPRELLRRLLPDPRRLREHRAVAWLGPALHHPRVWHISREGISLGVAIGLFFGVMVPIAQIPAAAATAILLRGNLPMAVLSTLITNPFTFAPIYYLAYRIGVLLTGAEQPGIGDAYFSADTRELTSWLEIWSERLVRLGKPLFVGTFVLATSLSIAGYFTVSGLWRVSTLRAWRRRGSTPSRSREPSSASRERE
ncbi:MAG TPA: DUF2062 domain-containing protein [Steroidobacteraceae bacterium]|nr:DUF2062 domain-containing protein [Steroidobacteraceae bacterium]